MKHKPKLGDTWVTRGGYPYRVICDDRKGDYSVVALVEFADCSGDQIVCCTKNGHVSRFYIGPFDLMPPKRFVKARLYDWGNDDPIAYGEKAFDNLQAEADKGYGKWVSDVVEIEVKDDTA